MSLSVRNMSGTYWGILSLAMAEIIRIIALNEQWLTGGANGISVLVIDSQPDLDRRRLCRRRVPDRSADRWPHLSDG